MNRPDPMRGWVLSFPEMLEEAWFLRSPSASFRLEPGRLFLLGGMGGSGMAGALAALLLERGRRPALTWRDAGLPGWLGPQDRLVVATYSGTTVESLAMLRESVARRIPTRAIASGGEALRICEEAAIATFEVPEGLAPRASLPWLLAGVLRATGGVGDEEVASAIRILRAELSGGGPERDPSRIAQALDGKLVILLPVGPAMEVVALRWRNQILENAKQGAFVSPLPEMAHNEVMGWDWLREASVPAGFVILPEEWPLPSPWAELAQNLRREAEISGFPVHLIPPHPDRGLGGMLAQILLGDRISVEMADLRGVAATPVETIRRLRDAHGKEQRS